MLIILFYKFYLVLKSTSVRLFSFVSNAIFNLYRLSHVKSSKTNTARPKFYLRIVICVKFSIRYIKFCKLQ